MKRFRSLLVMMNFIVMVFVLTTGVQAAIPTVTTGAVINITSASATSGGTVTDDGGAMVTARGVCWSTSVNPAIADSYTADGTGTAYFTSEITGLTPDTTYYVRAYATNQDGTSYGDQVEFSTTAVCNAVATLTATANDLTATFDTSGSVGTLLFDYGDGQTGTALTHTYTVAGTYTVTLTATDTLNNCSDSAALTVTVTTPPLNVISTEPADGATNVLSDAVITANLSKDLDASTINTETFYVATGTGHIPGTVTYSNKVATFTPASVLDSKKIYSATITTGVKDTDGKSLQSEYRWSFTPGTSLTPDTTEGWWNSLSLYNKTDTNGTAMLTIYEEDGDIGTVSLEIPARGLYTGLLSDLLANATISGTSGTGILGDSAAFADVSTTYNGGGFGIIGDRIQGQGFGMSPVTDLASFTLPYFPSSNNGTWWSALSVYNNTDTNGTATLEIFERDGDMASLTVNVPARGMYKDVLSNILTHPGIVYTPPGSVLGDSACFINVSCTFSGGGYGMTGNYSTGEGFGINPVADSASFTFPYFPDMNNAEGWWGSVSLYNNTDEDGTATLNIYEADGDRGTVTLSIAARGMYLNTLFGLVPTIVPDPGNTGSLGDSRCFAEVSCTFAGGGLGMIGNIATGEAMAVATTADRTDFIFPYFTPMYDSEWWTGFSLYNNSENEGTAALTFYEADGDKGTVELTIPARGMYVRLLQELSSLIIPDSGNSGNLGDSRVFIDVSADFNGGGFGMIGSYTYGIGLGVGCNTYAVNKFTFPYFIKETGDSPVVSDISASKSEIIVSFSKEMDPPTVTDNFFIRIEIPAIAYGTVAGELEYEGVAASFSPYTDLIFGRAYEVTVTTDARDTAGNHMISEFTHSFVGTQRKAFVNKAGENEIIISDQGELSGRRIEYTITVTSDSYGSIMFNGAAVDGAVIVNEGATPTFAFVPNNGYVPNDVVLDGVSTGSLADLTFYPVNADHTIDVSFRELTVTPVTPFNLDIDGNGQARPLTDGLLIMNYLSGSRGSALVGAQGEFISIGATRADPDGIAEFLDSAGFKLDIDGNGTLDSSTDGLLILRYLFGFTGDALIEDAIAGGAVRTSADGIETYLKSLVSNQNMKKTIYFMERSTRNENM